MQLDPNNIPEHIAIIMDGNGRWAKKKGQPRIFGHKNALKAVREAVEGSAEIGVKYLTLYAFSTENWNRPKIEVIALMELLVSAINKEVKTLNKNDIKLATIGDTSALPIKCQKELMKAIDATKNNKRMTLILALSYSSKWEILTAVKQIANDAKNSTLDPDAIDDQLFKSYLNTKNFPDPELLIRTSGEYRISNFLMYQLAYAELYFTDTLWPDFGKENLKQAIYDYQNRERRFGKTSEQLTAT